MTISHHKENLYLRTTISSGKKHVERVTHFFPIYKSLRHKVKFRSQSTASILYSVSDHVLETPFSKTLCIHITSNDEPRSWYSPVTQCWGT